MQYPSHNQNEGSGPEGSPGLEGLDPIGIDDFIRRTFRPDAVDNPDELAVSTFLYGLIDHDLPRAVSVFRALVSSDFEGSRLLAVEHLDTLGSKLEKTGEFLYEDLSTSWANLVAEPGEVGIAGTDALVRAIREQMLEPTTLAALVRTALDGFQTGGQPSEHRPTAG